MSPVGLSTLQAMSVASLFAYSGLVTVLPEPGVHLSHSAALVAQLAARCSIGSARPFRVSEAQITRPTILALYSHPVHRELKALTPWVGPLESTV